MNYINKIELYIDWLLKDKKLNIDLFPKNDKLPFELYIINYYFILIYWVIIYYILTYFI